jgi:hypothetical protein
MVKEKEITVDEYPSVPVTLPTPTMEYRTHRKTLKATVQPGMPVKPIPVPIPIPVLAGARVLMWKQDPSVAEIGIRKAYLPGHPLTGPRDGRITNGSPGIAPVSQNAFGDFIQTPGTDAFDAVHTFAVVRQTLTMYQRARAVGGTPAPLPWQWNSATNADPLSVFPHGLPDTMNAFYSRSAKALKFGDFISSGTPPPPRVFTCRSLDIVAHETGHAVLDGLKPGWLLAGNPPQTGGLHESFGDLTAIFLTLSQLDQVEAVIAQTKANLHDKTFLSDLAEQFGLALGRPNGLRNADNDLKLSEVGTEVHAISQVFTGAIYDILADIFAFEQKTAVKDDAAVLYEVGQYVCSLTLRALIGAPATGATFANVANQMLNIASADGKPVQYRNFIRNRFTVREVVVSPTPLHVDYQAKLTLEPAITDAPGAVQNRSGCCGTMNHPEYSGGQEALDAEIEALKKSLAGSGKQR